jgi:uncharacterized cupredoxin-like copper-binding protein
MVKKTLIALLAVLTLVGVACGGGSSEGGAGDEAAIPGSPGDASEADRKIKIDGKDSLEFDPANIEVKAGETVTFVITNSGKAEHEFVLGNEAYQEEHEEEMSGGGGHGGMEMGDESNSVSVAPGETEEITWTFTDAGVMLYGCHEPGHYKGGMVGSIEVV